MKLIDRHLNQLQEADDKFMCYDFVKVIMNKAQMKDMNACVSMSWIDDVLVVAAT